MTQLYSLDDVLTQVGAKQAWQYSQGAGIHIAFIDSGIAGDMKELQRNKLGNTAREQEYTLLLSIVASLET
jgi:hypothetical protein